MPWLETVKLSVYAISLAYLLHEMTHFGIALVTGRRPAFVLDGVVLAVDHDAGETLTLADHAIHAGPLIIGVLAAAAYLVAVQAWPSAWSFLGWGTYTLVGAPNDLRYREVEAAKAVE